MMTDFIYRFHPVGQGVFSTGSIFIDDNRFNWVFDCGSLALKKSLNPQIKWYKDTILENNHLDLLCISHFDSDHVNGLAELLTGLEINKIVIPYYTPNQRLLLYFTNISKPEPEYMSFLIDPIKFILEKTNKVNEIYLIYPDVNNPPDLLYPDNQAPSNGDAIRETQFSLLPESRESWNAGRVKCFSQSLALKCHSANKEIWEFIFFNKACDKNIKKELTGYLNGRGLEVALKDETLRSEIKRFYKENLKDINAGSTCMYSGPPYGDHTRGGYFPQIWNGFPPCGRQHDFRQYPWDYYPLCGFYGILYAGDAKFNDDYVKDLTNVLTKERMGQIEILQVPHHGSKHNWELNSRNLHHRWSVFCADPTRKRPGHPDKEVLLKLLKHNPILVDNHFGYALSGHI